MNKIKELLKVPTGDLVEKLGKLDPDHVKQTPDALIEQIIEKTIDDKDAMKVDLEAEKQDVLGMTDETDKDKAVKELIKIFAL